MVCIGQELDAMKFCNVLESSNDQDVHEGNLNLVQKHVTCTQVQTAIVEVLLQSTRSSGLAKRVLIHS